MKKFILALLVCLAPALSHATLSQSATPSPLGKTTNVVDATFNLGTVSGAGAADTSIALSLNGYAGAQFKIVKTAYRGTFKIQGSYDNSTFNDIYQSSNDGVATTETFYWQNFDGWNYFRVTGDPNASNAGTLAITGKMINASNIVNPRYTGYYGLSLQPQEIVASGTVTTAATTADFSAGGDGVQVMIDCTATSSGSLTVTVGALSPTGALINFGSTAAITAAGDKTLVFLPGWATATNSTFPYGTTGRWRITFDEGGTSTTYSASIVPLWNRGRPQ